MKKLLYFFYVVGILSVIDFIYNFVKVGSFDWLSLLIIICMVSAIVTLKKENYKQKTTNT